MNGTVKWVLGGTLALFLLILGWIEHSIFLTDATVASLRTEFAAHEAENKALASVSISRSEHEALQALMYGLRADLGEMKARVMINTNRIDTLETEMRDIIAGDFHHKKPPQTGP